MTAQEAWITYRASAYGVNKRLTFPLPSGWTGMDAEQRNVWAVGVLRKFNAQWIFVNVSG